MTTIKGLQDLQDFVDTLLDNVRGEIGQRSVVIALEGPLGAGKTTITKMIAEKLGIVQHVTSPTYVLHAEYPLPNESILLQHLDLYRLETEDEFQRLHIERMIDHHDFILIEWADKFKKSVLAFETNQVRLVWIQIGYAEADDERQIIW